MKKNKRGISIAISWILLIGFAVTLALIVIVWMKAFAQDTTETVKESTEYEMQCSEISLTATNISDCSNLIIEITNKGYFTIHKIKINSQIGTEEIDIPDSLKPTDTKTLNTNMNYSSMELGIVPVTKINNKYFVCPDREIKLKC